MRIFSLICFVLLIIVTSCGTQKKAINNYLENTHDTSGKDISALILPVIHKGDLLSIKVYSTAHGVEPKADAPYNLGEQSGGTSVVGYEVDQKGDIEYPQLGKIHVEGMTREQLADSIKIKLEDKLNQPSVLVRFLNYRITILGEVRTPGTFTFPTERVTILEALGLAGDVSEFGSKNNVKVMREYNGQREIGTLDLTSSDMFNSPFYRLQQNDVVFVEQTREKLKQEEKQNLVQNIGIASSIITAIAFILTIMR